MRNLQKTFLALTLATLGATASAEVVLYGQIRGGIELTQTKVNGVKGIYKDTTVTVDDEELSDKEFVKGDKSQTAIQDMSSRIGFRGQEQLGNGLKAIWQLEQKVDIAGTSGRGFGTRDSFIGLASDKLGEIKAGYFSSPLDAYAGETTDNWIYSNDSLGLGIHTRGNDVVGRRVAVQYTTPSFAGVQTSVYASPSDNNEGSTKGRDSAVYGLGVTYTPNDNVFAAVTGGFAKNGENNPLNKKDAYQVNVQGGYTNDKFEVGASYQFAKNVDNFGTEASPIYASRVQEVAGTVAYKPTQNIKLQASGAYGFDIKDQDKEKIGGNGKYYQAIVGAKYYFSKRTEAFGQVGYLVKGKNTDTSNKEQVTSGSVGLRHRF